MRPATTHDLVISVAVMVGFCLITIVMQIIIITKSTIPADTVITDIRVFRGEVSNDHQNTLRTLAEIRALIDTNQVRANTLLQMDSHGSYTNPNN